MKQPIFPPFLALLLIVVIALLSYVAFFKKSEQTAPQTDWRALITEATKPLQNKIDSLQRLRDTTVYVYRNRIDTIRLQPFTATVAMLDTMFADTVRYTDTTLLLTHSQGKQVGVWYAERLQCFEELAYSEAASAVKDTIIAEQVEYMVAMGDTLNECRATRPKVWRWFWAGFGAGVVGSAVMRLVVK